VERIPVQIVSGFLGAGKTTAIRAQLEQRKGEKIAVIVNDFGDASLDEVALAEGEPFRITNIPGGCVCCTAPEGFVDALGAVLAQRPDRLLIEPTGLARPQDLVDTIRRCAHAAELELAPVVVIVDPHQLAAAESSALLREQAQVADVLVANRTDLASESELAAFERYAAELWPAPLAVLRTRHGALAPEQLDWPEGEGPRQRPAPGHAHDHAHAPSTEGHSARSWLWPPDAVFSGRRLRDALAALVADPALARFKGIFRTEEGVSRLEIAGGVLHDRLTAFRRDSRADAIARGDAGALDRIGAALTAALLRDDERRVDPNRIEIVLPDGRVHGVDRAALAALPRGIDDVAPLFPKRSGAAARVEALFQALDLPATGAAVVVAGDGFASEPVAIPVLRQGVLLHSQEGEPLPASQGGPFRLLIPDSASPEPISCANVKGVAKVVLRS
jgi:G3E family GTPase